MEPARIDWKRLEWHFEEDKNYENINAPKWVDFLSPDKSVDDEAWLDTCGLNVSNQVNACL